MRTSSSAGVAGLPKSQDSLLFTPGPLTTSARVKQAMLHDVGSWHHEFNSIVAEIRARLLAVAGLTRESGWEVIPIQGSGTYGVEAVFQTCVPLTGKVAVFSNGAYGDRMVQMLKCAGIQHVVYSSAEDKPVPPWMVSACLEKDPAVTHVGLVHCETTTGILNPIAEIGQIIRRHGRVFVVDAMSSFGGMPIDFEACAVDFLVSSANKCIEGVPGFAFVFGRRELLLRCQGQSRSLSLDLVAQLLGFEKNGQFRFTPPTHVVLAFKQALEELEQEGGIPARAARYRANHAALVAGMGLLEIRPLLDPSCQSPIITAFHYPWTGFDFNRFYRELSDRGFIIYPGKLTRVDTFRIGSIGRLFPVEMERLVHAVEVVLGEMVIGHDGPAA